MKKPLDDKCTLEEIRQKIRGAEGQIAFLLKTIEKTGIIIQHIDIDRSIRVLGEQSPIHVKLIAMIPSDSFRAS